MECKCLAFPALYWCPTWSGPELSEPRSGTGREDGWAKGPVETWTKVSQASLSVHTDGEQGGRGTGVGKERRQARQLPFSIPGQKGLGLQAHDLEGADVRCGKEDPHNWKLLRPRRGPGGWPPGNLTLQHRGRARGRAVESHSVGAGPSSTGS